MKLPGGLELALLPKKTRGGTVFAGMALRFGDLKSLANLGDIPSMTTAMLMRGSSKHTRQQIEDELDRLKAHVNLGGWGSGPHRIETTRENLPAVLTLMTEVLREPAFDAKELEQLRAERLAGLEQQRSDPSTIAVTAFQKHLNPYPKGDIRYVDSIDEGVADIKAVTRDQMRSSIASSTARSPPSFPRWATSMPPRWKAQVDALFGGWKAAKPFTRVPTSTTK